MDILPLSSSFLCPVHSEAPGESSLEDQGQPISDIWTAQTIG